MSNVHSVAIVILYDLSSKKTGTNIRPKKIIESCRDFADIYVGFDEVKEMIAKQKHYESIYVECSTHPYMLRGGRLPIFKYLFRNIFSELSQLSRNKCVVFYRDAHWRFSRKSRSFRQWILIRYKTVFHQLECRQLDFSDCIIALPSLDMGDIVFSGRSNVISGSPGFDTFVNKRKSSCGEQISLLYSGAINSDQYDISGLIEFVSCNSDKLSLDVITSSIVEGKELSAKYPQIKFHFNPVGIASIDKEWDFFVDYRESNEYLSFSMPLKIFEAISCNLPVITTSGTSYGNFVDANSYGILVDSLEELITAGDSVFSCFEPQVVDGSWRSRIKAMIR